MKLLAELSDLERNKTNNCFITDILFTEENKTSLSLLIIGHKYVSLAGTGGYFTYEAENINEIHEVMMDAMYMDDTKLRLYCMYSDKSDFAMELNQLINSLHVSPNDIYTRYLVYSCRISDYWSPELFMEEIDQSDIKRMMNYNIGIVDELIDDELIFMSFSELITAFNNKYP